METIVSNENESYDDGCPQPIPVIINERPPMKNVPDRVPTIVKIKLKSKKVVTASELPVVVNLNPRSIYNKKNEF